MGNKLLSLNSGLSTETNFDFSGDAELRKVPKLSNQFFTAI